MHSSFAESIIKQGADIVLASFVRAQVDGEKKKKVRYSEKKLYYFSNYVYLQIEQI